MSQVRNFDGEMLLLIEIVLDIIYKSGNIYSQEGLFRNQTPHEFDIENFSLIYFNISVITGLVEGINNKIKVLKLKVYG